MKLTEAQMTEIAKECGFDMTGRLLKFANAVIAEQAKADTGEAILVAALNEARAALVDIRMNGAGDRLITDDITAIETALKSATPLAVGTRPMQRIVAVKVELLERWFKEGAAARKAEPTNAVQWEESQK